MDNEILLKAIEKLLDKKLDEKLNEKLEPVKQEIISIKSDIFEIKSRISSIESTQKTILKFVEEADKEFLKVEETYKFMNSLKKAINE